jgi:tetratricopeptide (TPR) repeat protein
LWGASYYFKQQFDSAQLMFQYINYAFAEKEKDGYYRTIGSARDGNSALSISTKEKNSLPRRVFAEPPSRNEAFIWQIRNYLARDRFTEAASLIQALKNDPLFPKRLYNDLEEVQAYSFYKQKNWDSSAAHLEKALDNATNKTEKARWEYLLAQIYEMTDKHAEAETWYTRSIGHTTDPIMDVYARLALVRVNKDSSSDYIDKNIATLLKMAKRDKYLDYRDIIYYMAAQMELERDNIDGALPLLLKSTKYTTNNPSQRNKAFLQLAELSFTKKLYRQSYNFYDSLMLDDPAIKNPDAIVTRKGILARLANNVEIIERQDSLQKIAAMPEDERKTLIKKLVKQIRKQQGLKDEGVATLKNFPSKEEAPPSLFADNNKKGEWYFYNKNSRQKGLKDFEVKWGQRANADNWRRSAALNSGVRPRADAQTRLAQPNPDATGTENTEITFDLLNDRIPLTPEKLQQSNDSIQTALFELGLLYIRELEDCSAATGTFEDLRSRFPEYPKMEEVLFNLYYCYNKQGEMTKAAGIKNLMNQHYSGSKLTTIVTTGKDPGANDGGKLAATRTYEKIYDLFIEGNFSEALAQKKSADSIYGSNHWTPQLLYIEAVYHIKQREDSAANIVLNNIVSQFNGTPLATKAITLLSVLRRRNEIEEELRNMVINMPAEDTTARQSEIIVTGKPVTTMPVTNNDSIKAPGVQPPVVINKPVFDTANKQPVKPPAGPA